MRKNHRNFATMEGLLRLWKIRLPDGRSAELQAKSKKKAAEQAAMIWALPVEWILKNARICAVS